MTRSGSIVVKFGGELVETPAARAHAANAIAVLARTRPVLVVHGGGKAIDAELSRRGITPRKADGLRITDAETLDTVVSVLAGTANTEFVAALAHAGVRVVGLTGADAACGRAVRSPLLQTTSGGLVDLGLVGDLDDVDPSLFELLMTNHYVPVVASIGLASPKPQAGRLSEPSLLNVNADVMACRIAAALGATELIIVGATPGVLDDHGASIPTLSAQAAQALITSGTASAGMVAKIRACLDALADGVTAVRIIDGRSWTGDLALAPGTTLSLAVSEAPLDVHHHHAI